MSVRQRDQPSLGESRLQRKRARPRPAQNGRLGVLAGIEIELRVVHISILYHENRPLRVLRTPAESGR